MHEKEEKLVGGFGRSKTVEPPVKHTGGSSQQLLKEASDDVRQAAALGYVASALGITLSQLFALLANYGLPLVRKILMELLEGGAKEVTIDQLEEKLLGAKVEVQPANPQPGAAPQAKDRQSQGTQQSAPSQGRPSRTMHDGIPPAKGRVQVQPSQAAPLPTADPPR